MDFKLTIFSPPRNSNPAQSCTYSTPPSHTERSAAPAERADTPKGNCTLTAKAGADPARGPAAQQAQAEPGRTQANQPRRIAQRARRSAATWEPKGTNRQAGEGR